MHEYSISYEIVKVIIESAINSNAKRVNKVMLEIGDLTLINAEQLKFWIKELIKGTIADGAKLRVKVIKPEIFCEDCGFKIKGTGPICMKCKSKNLKMIKGKECLIKGIEIEQKI